MKRYVWTAVALVFVNAYASENPFALKENLQKIDHDQEVLLSELSKLAEAREKDDIIADEPKPVIKTIEVEERASVDDEQPVKMADSEEQYNLANAIDELVGGTENTEPKKSVKNKNDEALEKQLAIKKAQEREEERRAVEAYEKQRAQKLAQETQAAEKVKAQEKEAERKAVAEYEKQRTEKLARQAKVAEEKARKEAVEKVASIDSKAEKSVEKKVVQAEQSSTVVTKKELSLDDIDVAAEQKAAKEAADAAYLAAVREMDQEEEN